MGWGGLGLGLLASDLEWWEGSHPSSVGPRGPPDSGLPKCRHPVPLQMLPGTTCHSRKANGTYKSCVIVSLGEISDGTRWEMRGKNTPQDLEGSCGRSGKKGNH